MICRILLRSVVSKAWSFARLKAGKSNPARMAMMAMTTNNSIKVKAIVLRARGRCLGFIKREDREAESRLSTARQRRYRGGEVARPVRRRLGEGGRAGEGEVQGQGTAADGAATNFCHIWDKSWPRRRR